MTKEVKEETKVEIPPIEVSYCKHDGTFSLRIGIENRHTSLEAWHYSCGGYKGTIAIFGLTPDDMIALANNIIGQAFLAREEAK